MKKYPICHQKSSNLFIFFLKKCLTGVLFCLFMPIYAILLPSLPYIDAEPTKSQIAETEALISAEKSKVRKPALTEYCPSFSPLIKNELERISKKQKIIGIDYSRFKLPFPQESYNSNINSISNLNELLVTKMTSEHGKER